MKNEDSSSQLEILRKVPGRVAETVDKIRDLLEVSGAGEILRRYFVMNAFDGALTMLGFVIGAYMSGLRNPYVIISAGLGASFAMGVSGFVGALITEKAERERKVKELEKAMFAELEGSIIQKASNAAVILAAVTDSMAPALAAVSAASPFVLSMYGILAFETAALSSIALTLAEVFALGVYLGSVSGRNSLLYGLYMLAAGIIVSFVITLGSRLENGRTMGVP